VSGNARKVALPAADFPDQLEVKVGRPAPVFTRLAESDKLFAGSDCLALSKVGDGALRKVAVEGMEDDVANTMFENNRGSVVTEPVVEPSTVDHGVER
jgi:hypothetical protein